MRIKIKNIKSLRELNRRRTEKINGEGFPGRENNKIKTLLMDYLSYRLI